MNNFEKKIYNINNDINYIEELHKAFDHFKNENDIRLKMIEKKCL